MLQVRLLGKFEVSQDGKSLAIPSRPAQSLFAYLILNSDSAHRREKLAGLLWPDSLEETARDNLRHALWRARKAFPSDAKTQYLLSDDLSIHFNSSAEYWLDAAELKKLDESATADELMVVLSQYQGELLPGFYDEWILLEREHLSSIFEHHMARLLSLLQEEKRWLDILEWSERWIKLGQKPEPAYRALMYAHAAKGDMSKVATIYERCVKSLRELGVEPSEQTRALYDRLKVGEESADSEPVAAAKGKHDESPKTKLPMPITSFIGREREIEEVKHLLSTTRLLTLNGTGGIGKTRMAIQVASELARLYRDGVYWVELASVKDSQLVPQSVAQVLGARESPGQPLTESLIGFLREKQLLLIFDNCEHVITSCAQLANDLLTQCPHLKVLTTSREPLQIMGETTFQVPGLSFPVLADLSELQNLQEFESIRLFAARAAAVHPEMGLTQKNLLAVSQICQRLDGIPLAIELAAARVRMFSLEEILLRLDDRFNLLTQGSRTALPRHQTLRALLEWSHDLLPEPERVLWRRLSIFMGGWTLAAAESICIDHVLQSPHVFELLSHLVDKSLVIVDELHGATRYRMLETIRHYGQEKLQVSEEDSTIHGRHLAYFLELAENATSRLLTDDQKKWFAKLDVEYGNLRSAFEWALEGDTAKALRLAVALGQYWEVRGYIGEGRNALEQALSRTHGPANGIFADGLRWLAKFAARQGDYASAKALLEESLNLSRKLGNKSGLARSLHNLGMVYSLQGNYLEAKSYYEQSLALSKEVGDRREIAALTTSLGNVTNYMGDYETARRYQEESVSIFRELGEKFGLFIALNNLGIALERQGDNAGARRNYEESIATADELGEKNLIAYALNGLAHVLYLEDDLVEANRYYRKSLLISQEIGEKRCIAYCLEGFAKIALRQGNYGRAAQLLGAAESLRQAIGGPLNQAEQEELQHDLVVARHGLGKKGFATQYAAGQSIALEQAIGVALTESRSSGG